MDLGQRIGFDLDVFIGGNAANFEVSEPIAQRDSDEGGGQAVEQIEGAFLGGIDACAFDIPFFGGNLRTALQHFVQGREADFERLGRGLGIFEIPIQAGIAVGRFGTGTKGPDVVEIIGILVLGQGFKIEFILLFKAIMVGINGGVGGF